MKSFFCCYAGISLNNAQFSKADFARVWETSIQQAATPKVVKSSFERTGFYPFDPTAIDTSKISKKESLSIKSFSFC
jgi:hypothetical protein